MDTNETGQPEWLPVSIDPAGVPRVHTQTGINCENPGRM